MEKLNFDELDKTINSEPLINFADIYKEALIDPSEEIKQQPIAISIGESQYKATIIRYHLEVMATLVA